MTMEWGATGATVRVDPGRIRAAEQAFEKRYDDAVRHRRHLWTAIVAFAVTPPMTDGAVLDSENIVSRPTVGCYICEGRYTPGAENTRCPGEPK